MKDYIFSEQDIDGDTLEYIDKYFKKVIIARCKMKLK